MARTPRKGSWLTPEHWRDAALKQIALGGVDSVNLNEIAKTLGVTKGGFYWHFQGRDALLLSALQEWSRCDSRVAERLEAKGGTAREKLTNLLKICVRPTDDVPGGALEMAFREWARSNDQANQVVRAVQKHRVSYVRYLYMQMGLEEESAEMHAVGLLAHVTGQTILASTSTKADSRRRFERGVMLLIDSVEQEVAAGKSKGKSAKVA